MTVTYEKIATTTLGSAGSFSFTSIPSTYTDLRIVVVGTSTGGNDLVIRFNNDTGSNYSLTYVGGSGTAAASGRGTSLNYIDLDYYGSNSTSIPHNYLIDVMNYSNATTYKTALARNNGDAYLNAMVGLWRSTSAINRVDIFTVAGNMATGTTATIYGIKAE